MDSVLRPRDIQARIRGGESPEDVAAAAQTSVDKIMGFATPVLAERAYQAELAQKASVRRRTATGPVGHLGQAVESFLDEERPYMELGRRGEPEEVASVIAFLCSARASFVNGSNYRVDSGSVATI